MFSDHHTLHMRRNEYLRITITYQLQNQKILAGYSLILQAGYWPSISPYWIVTEVLGVEQKVPCIDLK